MTIFDEYKTYTGDASISSSLLWEYDLSHFDWWKSRKVVVQRVIERGWLKDFYAAFKLYGGIEGFREIIKEVPNLSSRDMNFVCIAFNLKKRRTKMLHTETVARSTLELLKMLESESVMSDFNLAGGTSLALYLGHRISVDLVLFTPESFDAGKLEIFLRDKYGFRTDFMEKNTLKGTIDGVKIDCITHPYSYLEKPYTESDIRLYSMEDIVAMKLSAIADNGSRLKDFIDIAFLSTRFPFNLMLRLYERKFPGSNLIRPFKAITYFEDIDFEEDIVMLNGKYDWKLIERRLIDMTQIQNKVFESFPLS